MKDLDELAEKHGATSDGSTAKYYELPLGATELQDLISHKNMNSQMGEIFRATYRYGECSHSDMMRDIKKILFYAEAEKERILLMYRRGIKAPTFNWETDTVPVADEDCVGPGCTGELPSSSLP